METRSIGLLLHAAARAYRSAFEKQAREHKASLQQWRTLALLAKRDGLTQAALAQAAETSPMTMSDILDRLEARGWVQRETDPADSRAKLVRLLPDAHPHVDDLHAVAQELKGIALAGMTDSEIETLATLLEKIIENFETSAPTKA